MAHLSLLGTKQKCPVSLTIPHATLRDPLLHILQPAGAPVQVAAVWFCLHDAIILTTLTEKASPQGVQ